jgi:hypothetical protein
VCMCMHTSSTLRVCFLILGYYHQSNTRLLFVLAPRMWSHRSLPTTPEACAISAPSLYVSVVMIKSFFYLYEMSFILISQVISRVLFPNLACALPSLVDRPPSTSPPTLCPSAMPPRWSPSTCCPRYYPGPWITFSVAKYFTLRNEHLHTET